MSRPYILLVLLCSVAVPGSLRAQTPAASGDDIRVTVSVNQDGWRTTYQFDNANHKATATTTGTDGKVRGKIRYVLDAEGRFASGEVFGPAERFLFKTLYKYDAGGRLMQETQMAKDDTVVHRLVYSYDAQGHQSGYAIYDGAGKLEAQTSAPGAKPSATKKLGH